MNNEILDNVISSKEAAELLGYNDAYVKQLCAKGKIVAKKIGNVWIIDKSKLMTINKN